MDFAAACLTMSLPERASRSKQLGPVPPEAPPQAPGRRAHGGGARSGARCAAGWALALALQGDLPSHALGDQVERRKAEAERVKQEEKRKKAQKLLAEAGLWPEASQ